MTATLVHGITGEALASDVNERLAVPSADSLRERSQVASDLESGAAGILETFSRPLPTKLTPWERNGIIGMMIPLEEYKVVMASGVTIDVPVTSSRAFTNAVVPRVVSENIDTESFPFLAEIRDALKSGKRSPYALYLKDNAFGTWESYGITWCHFTAEDVIGHYKVPGLKQDQTEQEGTTNA